MSSRISSFGQPSSFHFPKVQARHIIRFLQTCVDIDLMGISVNVKRWLYSPRSCNYLDRVADNDDDGSLLRRVGVRVRCWTVRLIPRLAASLPEAAGVVVRVLGQWGRATAASDVITPRLPLTTLTLDRDRRRRVGERIRRRRHLRSAGWRQYSTAHLRRRVRNDVTGCVIKARVRGVIAYATTVVWLYALPRWTRWNVGFAVVGWNVAAGRDVAVSTYAVACVEIHRLRPTPTDITFVRFLVTWQWRQLVTIIGRHLTASFRDLRRPLADIIRRAASTGSQLRDAASRRRLGRCGRLRRPRCFCCAAAEHFTTGCVRFDERRYSVDRCDGSYALLRRRLSRSRLLGIILRRQLSSRHVT